MTSGTSGFAGRSGELVYPKLGHLKKGHEFLNNGRNDGQNVGDDFRNLIFNKNTHQ